MAYGSFESRTCVRLQGISASLYNQRKQIFVYAFCRRWLVFVFHHLFLRARCVSGGCCPGITFLHEGVAYDTSSGLGQTSPDPTFNTPAWSPQSPLVPFCALTTTPPLPPLDTVNTPPRSLLRVSPPQQQLGSACSWSALLICLAQPLCCIEVSGYRGYLLRLKTGPTCGKGTVRSVNVLMGWLKTARMKDCVK